MRNEKLNESYTSVIQHNCGCGVSHGKRHRNNKVIRPKKLTLGGQLEHFILACEKVNI